MNAHAGLKKLLVVLVLALGAAVFAPSAGAAPALDGTFTPSGQPGQMTLGPDGNVWFTLISSSDSKEFGRITPDGTITEYDSPNNQIVVGITSGPDQLNGNKNRIWMTQSGSVVKWDPVAESGTALPVPQLNSPRGITADDSGFLWAVDDADGLVRISALGDVTEFNVAGSGGRGITFSGDLWWADFGQSSINRSTQADASNPTKYDVGGNPQEVAAGAQGQIGYTNQGDFPHTVGLISSAGQVTEIEVPDTDPFGITFAEDGAYWVANFASDDLTRLTADGQVTAPIQFPAGSGPRYLSKGSDGTVWVGLETSAQIARITGVKSENGGGGHGVKLRMTGVKLLKGKKLRVRAVLSKQARVRITVDRKKRKRFVKVRSVTRKGAKGTNVFALARPKRKGAYRVRVVAISGSEKTSQVIRKFRVNRR